MTIPIMHIGQQLKKPDWVGLGASAILSFFAIISTPAVSWATHWQVLIVVAPLVINILVWRKESTPPMSFGKAVGQFIGGVAILIVVAAIDTALGFAFGAHSVFEAFLNSGPAGGPVDIFLAAMFLFVGLPTIVRSVYEFYALK